MNKVKEKLSGYLNSVGDDWNYILPEELYKDLKNNKDYFLLDLRRKEDYLRNHINGSENIFWLDILKENNVEKLPRDKRIILICYVGHTASQVLVILKLLGFDVKVLKFGMGHSPVKGVSISGWINMSFDIE
jgi:rhodanese-related sulfurtransferase